MIDIKYYCTKCRSGIVKPFHNECFRTCKYSAGRLSKDEYKTINLKDGKWSVYFIKCKDFIKIGKTTDIFRRLDDFQRDNPFDTEILLLIKKCPDNLEFALHKYFFDLRFKREWFVYKDKLLKFIHSDKNEIRKICNIALFNYQKYEGHGIDVPVEASQNL